MRKSKIVNTSKILSKKSMIKMILNSILIFGLFVFSHCDEDNSVDDLKADFSYEYKEVNHVVFTNQSEGEYYSMTWNFGNGKEETTTDKKKTYEVYYPLAGDYDVTLKLLNYSGGTKVTSKTINIASTDFVISFTAEVDALNPNIINLENTSQGQFESFKWIYRDKEIVDETAHAAYFPFVGSYEIELQVIKNGNEISLKKSISISQNDPDYIDNLSLVWSDEFDGLIVNSDNWTFETGATGWGNNELQNYTNGGNAEIVNGYLIITAIKLDDNTAVGSYSSSRIISKGKKEFKYGRMEVRANVPEGRGIWPAIWMLGSNISSVGWPVCGEIDIMEYVGYEPNTVHATVHTPSGYAANGDGTSVTLVSCEEEFHNYGIIWTEKQIDFYIDTPENIIYTYNPILKSEDNWPFDKPQFFILNIAVGGDWGGAQGVDNSIFPQTMEIDYVRVYQEVL
ncbi:MAG TPA: hypothetical protein DCG75_17415 [Bacteroidales bacterium]|nr:hypothetical protein [Bacteroidales bacterium]